MKCPHNINNQCAIVQEMTQLTIATNEKTCEACTMLPKARMPNKVTCGLAILAINNNHKNLDDYPNVKKLLLKQIEEGPGTELKKLISWFPIPNKNNCAKCKALEVKMNQWGVEKCIEKKKYIITKLLINAKRKNIPTTEFIISTLLNKAIRNAKRLDSSSNNRT